MFGKILSSKFYFYAFLAVIAAACYTGLGSFYYLEGGDYARVQYPDGSYSWVTSQRSEERR